MQSLVWAIEMPTYENILHQYSSSCDRKLIFSVVDLPNNRPFYSELFTLMQTHFAREFVSVNSNHREY